MKKYIYSIVAATALFASCSQDAELNEIGNTDSKAITTIGASTENSTRAIVSSTDNTKVNWEDGDQLGVLGTNGSSDKNLAYTLNSGSGTTNGIFQNGSSDITAISAIMYPYQENATWADSKLTCEIPSVQTAVNGSFDKAAAIMYSIGNTTDVQLNYAVNFLKITIGSLDANIHSITISSPSTQLSGRAEVTTSGVAAVSGQSLKSVTLSAGKNKTFETGDYYIAVMTGNIVTPTISIIRYENGHTAKEYAKAGRGNLVFASGNNVKPITVDFKSLSATGREAVQLWENGTYWATFNVGATTPEESGKYYAWGDIVGQTFNGSWSGGGFNSVPTLVPANPSVLPLYYDAAAANWNTAWRMPTGGWDEEADFEFNALKTNTNYTIDNNYHSMQVYGLKLTGKDSYSDITLFMPAAGNGHHSTFYDNGSIGDYWSNTLNPEETKCACHLFFNRDGAFNPPSKDSERFRGFTVRAVLAD